MSALDSRLSYLPFLLGFPTLISKGANLHLKYLTLSFLLHIKYHRLKLIFDGDHVYLRFISNTVALQVIGERSATGHYSGTINQQMHVTHCSNRGRNFYTLSLSCPSKTKNSKAAAQGIVWQLNVAAYGPTDSGRLCFLTFNHNLINGHTLTQSKYDHTLF